MAWLEHDVQISAAQAEALRPEVEKTMRQLNELRLEANQRRKQIFGEMLARISQDLTGPQREKLQTAVQQAIARQAAAAETSP